MLENISQQQKKRRSQRILSNSVNMSARRSNVIGCRFQCDKITPTPTSYSKTLPVEVTVQKWNCLLGNTLNTISALGHSTILSQSERDTCLSKALRTTRLLPDDQNVNLGSVAYALQMHGYSYTISKKVSMECSLLQQYTIKYQFPLLVLLEMSYASGDKRQHLIGIVPIKVENEVCMHIVDGCHPEKKTILLNETNLSWCSGGCVSFIVNQLVVFLPGKKMIKRLKNIDGAFLTRAKSTSELPDSISFMSQYNI
jgi:hypothetical protein